MQPYSNTRTSTLSLYIFLLLLTNNTFFSSSSSTHYPVHDNNINSQTSQSLSHYLACKSTLYPKLCRSILSTLHYSSSPSPDYNSYHEYGKFSVKESIKQAKKTSNLINQFLFSRNKWVSYMSLAELRALHDCNQLTQLSIDYLETISIELNSADLSSVSIVDRLQSLLSAVLTNQHTCLDGLLDSGSSIPSGLTLPFSNMTELYSISLGLVSHALGRTHNKLKKKSRKRDPFLNNKNSKWRNVPFHSDSESNNWVHKIIKRRISSSKSSSSSSTTTTTISSSSRRNLLGDEEENNEGGIQVRDAVTVAKDGTGNFTTIGDAINFAPNNTNNNNNNANEDGYFVIYVNEGIYEDEYIVVPKYKKYIMLLGDGINRTIITGNRSVVDGWTTFNSATFAVSGEGFVAIDVTFRNTAGPEKHQAVAVRNNADLSTFYRCSFEGYQDTLYIHSLRQFYRECDIYGTVDFIFGNSASVFQNCNLIARKPMDRQKNAITAQGRTDPNQNTGISIHNCTVIAAPELVNDLNSTRTYLGRPWKLYSRTVFMQSFIDNVIDPVGWLEWNGTVGLDTLYYGEFENYGPGANISMRVQWPGYNLMNAEQAVNFTVYNFTMGDTWLPSTEIPFSKGLL